VGSVSRVAVKYTAGTSASATAPCNFAPRRNSNSFRRQITRGETSSVAEDLRQVVFAGKNSSSHLEAKDNVVASRYGVREGPVGVVIVEVAEPRSLAPEDETLLTNELEGKECRFVSQ
jgi:hypothetical protein